MWWWWALVEEGVDDTQCVFVRGNLPHHSGASVWDTFGMG